MYWCDFIVKILIKLFMKTSLYSWFLKKILPYIRFSTYYTKIRGELYHAGYELLKPGHIIVTTDDRKLSSMVIPGYWSHAALCIGKYPDNAEICEMTHTDFTESYFFDLCKEADHVMILECVNFSDGYIQKMIEKCLSFKGAKYDVEFTLGVEALYCSELIYQSDYLHLLELDLSDLAGLGRPYISPDGLTKARNVKVIWDSKKP